MNIEKIKNIKIDISSSILDALKLMDLNNTKLLLVFKNNSFLNILSIGDIQRAIIKNFPLDSKIENILRKKPLLSYNSENIETIKKRMFEFRTECMPILNENNELVDVYFWNDIFPTSEKRIIQKLNLPVVIMAGGKGVRLKPLTNVLPKPLIPINEKTIIENIMDNFLNVGCNNFYISVNFKYEVIQYYFKSLNNEQYNISYIHEEKPLGTVGSLYLLKNKINTPFFISNCDIIIDEDYGEIYKYHKENNNNITIVAALKHYKIPYGTIETKEDGLLISLNEKPEIIFKINSGLYILNPEILQEIPDNKFYHITELIEDVRKKGYKVGVFPVSEKSWKDIGNMEDYYKIIK